MTGALACVVAFILVYNRAQRGLGHGVGALLLVGYAYGIVRARIHDSGCHFMFDSGVVALYLERYGRWSSNALDRSRRVMPWLVMLGAWPTMLMLIPQNHILIQLVGLRAAIFFLPMVALGTRAERVDLDVLVSWIAALNLVAFAFALAEFFVGIEPFFPRNPVTALMYGSADVAAGKHRIPATFSNAHAYAGTMVATLPFLLTGWQAKGRGSGERALFSAAIVATMLGVFIAGPRLPVVILFAELAVLGATVHLPVRLKVALASFGAIVAGVVGQSDRFQRFLLLRDTDKVVERVGWSVNMSFVEMLKAHPFGAGLGSAAGTSVPWFLTELLSRPQVGMENEYGRIALEQSLVGLALWISFIFNTVTQPSTPVSKEWILGTRMMKVFVLVSWGTAFIGTGMLTAIPQTPLLLLQMGLLWRAPLRTPTRPATPLRPATAATPETA